ncbi:MAG: DUF455 family protein [Bdellovibrionota bacterium]
MRSGDIKRENQWQPFRLAERGDAIRAMQGADGVADRLRLVAFAELQARDAFRSGAERFAGQIDETLRQTWLRFADVEDRHAQMLLARMTELGIEPGSRAVSDKLTRLCAKATDPIVFLFLLSSAEERGMEQGKLLGEQMLAVDEASAKIFLQIAEEEVEHVQMARDALATYDLIKLRDQARAVNALL